jgi:geranylgeranyl diphosphate synthase, type II
MEQIPAEASDRDAMARGVEAFVAGRQIVPPLSFAELTRHTEDFLHVSGADRKYLPFAAVLLNNEVWKGPLAAVPFDRRLLLLPQCLRAKSCRGTIDEFGLKCARCGACLIDSLHELGRRLGYAVLVAEGTPVVAEMIRSGQIQGIVGVSCLSALERVFPLMEAAAAPAVAVPLLRDGCEDTAVDAEWIFQAMLRHDGNGSYLDMRAIQKRVEEWFTPPALAEILGPEDGPTDRIARQWLLEAGKRWRPLLATCAYAAVKGCPADRLPPDVPLLAVAVECFHKASLVHDDIEDGDATRYGRPAVHERWGVPVALNVGDFLLGEGYRLIGKSDLSAEFHAMLLRAAAEAHRELCLGQGEELSWLREFRPLGAREVLGIFRRKTAPAFAGALRFGAICAGLGEESLAPLDEYSEHLGVAYQVQDDLADFRQAPAKAGVPRPSIVLALAHETASGEERRRVLELWRSGPERAEDRRELADLAARLGAEEAARKILHFRLRKAMEALGAVRIMHLKRLLRQVLGSIFPDAMLDEAGVLPRAASGGPAGGRSK